jgi:uncharacterized membrane protein
MSSSPLGLATLGAALGAGVVAGVFFAFSTFVLPALFRLPAAQGVAAMQSINVVVINRWFMGAFLGTGMLCLLLAIASLRDWGAPGTRLRLAGAVLYLTGTLLVTVAGNVPLNDALAPLRAESGEAARLWPDYVAEWTRWNHVRAAAAFATSAMLTMSLRGP